MSVLLVVCACESSSGGTEVTVEVKVGERVRDFCARTEERGVLRCADLNALALSYAPSNENIAAVLPREQADLARFEGLFAPGTYRFGEDETPERILTRLLEAGVDRLDHDSDLPLTLYERMILASIVEKEAANNRDYDKVASVFLNRLEDNSVLGSCPTVEYALGYHRPFLLFKDLELESPYNVYKRRGLPPTPIAFFSDEALRAVENPIETDLFFFVFDWTLDEFQFAETYAEHRRNAEVARENFKRRYGRDMMYRRFDDLYYEAIPETPAAQ